jgi:hypothetical protein
MFRSADHFQKAQGQHDQNYHYKVRNTYVKVFI